MRCLIVYATTEGQTRKIARFCADQLVALGHSVEMLSAQDADDIEIHLFDLVLLAGSVHIGRVQHALSEFATVHAQTLNRMATLFILVSLGIASGDPDDRAELDSIAQDFQDDTGWYAGQVEHVAGAFRFGEYDFFKSMAMRWIARQRGQSVSRHGDSEFTDWQGLAEIIKTWIGSVPANIAWHRKLKVN